LAYQSSKRFQSCCDWIVLCVLTNANGNAASRILLRANLPIAVALVWVSNPFTWLILYTPPYLLGLAILGEVSISLDTITMQMMFQQLTALWIGCLIFGSASAVAGYTLCNVIWRMVIVNKWTSRKKKLATVEPDNNE